METVFLICINRATKKFQHSVVSIVTSISSAGVWDNHSPKCKPFSHITSAVPSAELRQRGACSISRARGPQVEKISQHLLNHKVCG